MRKLRDVLCLAVAVCLLTLVGANHSVVAVEPDEILSDAKLEARARKLSAELRCLVCQNQSIDDSNAPLARDLRVLVRERLQAGDGDGEILDYVVARYGEFVLLRPRFSVSTLILWLAPVLLLAGGIWLARGVMRAQAPVAPADELSAKDQARLAEILEDAPKRD